MSTLQLAWSALLDHRTYRAVHDRYRGWLTPMGRALLACLGATSVLHMGTSGRPLDATIGLLGGLLAGCVVMGRVALRPKVAMGRRLPPPPSAGDTWSYEVWVENRGERPLYDLVVEERALPAQLVPVGEPPVIEELQPGERSRVRLELSCPQRGAFTLGALQVATTWPAGLFKAASRSRASDRLLVYPRFTPLQDFEVPANQAHQPGGIPAASVVGESIELARLREWRDGDRPRDVVWPVYARTGRLVVREYQEEYFARLALVVDLQATRRADRPAFERGVSTAASIADALARREYIIDIFAAGEQVHQFRAGRALAHFQNILDLLACLDPGQRFDTAALEAVIVPQASRLSAMIFVLTDWNADRATVVGIMKSLGVAVRVINVGPGLVEGLAPDEVVVLP